MGEILEIILEIILDCGTEIVEQKKLSKTARIIICLIITGIMLAFIGGIVWVFIINDNIVFRIFECIAIILIIIYLARLWRRIRK